MKQLQIHEIFDSLQVQKGDEWSLYIDGASRNNPGRAGAGIYIVKDGQSIVQQGYYLGIKTNNEAEYLALLLGLFAVKNLLFPDDKLTIISDSELLVRQMKHLYKVKRPQLKVFHSIACDMLHGINYSFMHVLREKNKVADMLANKGIDDGLLIPQDFLAFLKAYDVML